MRRLAHLVHTRRRPILAVAGFLFIGCAVLAPPAARELSTSADDFYDPHGQDVAATERIAAATGIARLGLIALVPTAADVRYNAKARARVGAVAEEIKRTPGIGTVIWPPFEALRRVTARAGRLTLVPASVTGDAATVARRVRAEVRGTETLVGGTDVAASEMGDQTSRDATRAEIAALPLLFLLSLWIFRSPVAAMLPTLVGGLSIITTVAVLRLLNASVAGLSVYSLNLVTGLGFGLGIDYALLIVSRYREELRATESRQAALSRTLETAGRTVFFSSLTIAAALACLTVFPLPFLYSMGIGGILVALVSMAVSLTVLPAALSLLGSRVNAWAPPRWRGTPSTTSGRWRSLATWVTHRPKRVAIITAAALLAASAPLLHVRFVSIDYKMLPVGSNDRVVGETVAREFPGAAGDPIDVVVTGGSNEGAELHQYARTIRALAPKAFISPRPLNRSTWLIELQPRGDPLGARNVNLVRRVRQLPTPLDAVVGGTTARNVDQRDALVSTLPLALSLLVGVTTILIFLFTGSVVLPLKMLLMNVLSVGAALGLLVFVFQAGRFEALLGYRSVGGIELTQPVLLAAIAFGLATDYGVFLIARIKEAHYNEDRTREAIAFGLERTGRVITSAALLFCVAVGALATSSLLQVKQLAIGTVLAVAIDAAIVRTLLVPSLMALLGRWNWWAPATLRRAHARLKLGEQESVS